MKCNTVDMAYLKQRVTTLSHFEKTVILLVDEIYTAKRVEYSNGKFIGLTDDGKVAKTVVTFMVQSLCSKYRDVVCIVPVESLTIELLEEYYYKVMVQLRELMFVQGLSSDDHPFTALYLQNWVMANCNRKCHILGFPVNFCSFSLILLII